MADYDLDEDEAVILQETGVNAGKFETVDLILTNKNIIQINRGFLGGTKKSIKYPLSKLKIFKGKANVLIGKSRNGEKQLELYFTDCEKYYKFNSARGERTWVHEIIKAHKDRMAESAKSQKESFGKNSIFQSITGTMESAKNILSAKRTPVKKTCKCPNCGAELTGSKGSEVQCSYCDAIVVIK